MDNEADRIECDNCGRLELKDIGQWEIVEIINKINVVKGEIIYKRFKEYGAYSGDEYGWRCLKCGVSISASEQRIIRTYGGKDE